MIEFWISFSKFEPENISLKDYKFGCKSMLTITRKKKANINCCCWCQTPTGHAFVDRISYFGQINHSSFEYEIKPFVARTYGNYMIQFFHANNNKLPTRKKFPFSCVVTVHRSAVPETWNKLHIKNHSQLGFFFPKKRNPDFEHIQHSFDPSHYLNSLIKYASCSCSLPLPITIDHSKQHTCSMFIDWGVGSFIAIMWKSIEKRVTHLIYCSNQTVELF